MPETENTEIDDIGNCLKDDRSVLVQAQSLIQYFGIDLWDIFFLIKYGHVFLTFLLPQMLSEIHHFFLTDLPQIFQPENFLSEAHYVHLLNRLNLQCQTAIIFERLKDGFLESLSNF